jgi:hypothetical protein
VEITFNGIDDDCDPATLDEPPVDNDGDGSFSDVDCDDNDPARYPGAFEICDDGIDNDCDNQTDLSDTYDCGPAVCGTETLPQNGPHMETLLNPDDTVHPDQGALRCGKCHYTDAGGATVPGGEYHCQRCHADPNDPSDPLNGVMKIQYPDPWPYGFGSAQNVVSHSSNTVGTAYGNWDIDCTVCHNPHSQEQDNKYKTSYGKLIKRFICFDNQATGQTILETIEFTSDIGPGSFADGPPYIENICNTCHTLTNHQQRDGTAPDGQDHNNEQNCMTCHPHNSGFKPVGGGSCLSCHNQSPPAGSSDLNRRQIVEGIPGNGSGDFVRTSHHVTDGTANQIVTPDACLVCHDQSVHMSFGDGFSVLLNDQDGGPAYPFDGTGASIEGFCISCHDSDGSLINGSQPFSAAGDLTSPPDIGWGPGLVSHSIDDACLNCHGDSAGNNAHGSDSDFLLQYNNYISGASETFCYNCHNGTLASTDIQSFFGLSYTHGVEDCQECHNPHRAEPGTHTSAGQWYPSFPDENTHNVSGVLSGVFGVEPSPWPAAWVTTENYEVFNSAVKEYQICFKCHAKYSHQYSEHCTLCHPLTWTGDVLIIGFAFRSAGREFNPNNKSAHPVVVTLNNKAGSYIPQALSINQMKSPWTNVGNQTMFCSDCHGAENEDAGDPRGPHGSDNESILKGPNTLWPIGNAGVPFSLNDVSNMNRSAGLPLNTNLSSTLFCLNCHNSFPSSNNNTWQNEAHKQHDDREYQPTAGSDHNVYCIACHTVVPHGNRVSRMIAYRSQLPEYTTVNGTNYSVIQGFKKASRFNYDDANCFTVQGLGCHPHESDQGSQVGGYDQ